MCPHGISAAPPTPAKAEEGRSCHGCDAVMIPEPILLSLCARASLVAKLLPAMQETLVQFLGWEDLLQKGWATHSNILRLPCWLIW